MGKKRRYQAIPVNDDRVESLIAAVAGQRVVVGIDIAKTKEFAAFMTEDGRVHATVRWAHPKQSPQFLQVLARMRQQGSRVELAMEPSSTYGDALRAALLEAGFPVFRVSPKRSHDAAEVYDGVPSLHDAKSAAIVAKLHLDGLSEVWGPRSEYERGLAAGVSVLRVFETQYRGNCNRLEALLARHWPELFRELEHGSATSLELLMEFGSAREVAERREEARELMRRVGGARLASERIDAVLDAAESTFGIDPTAEEREAIQAIAAEARRCQQASRKAKRTLEKRTEHEGAAREMRHVVGKTTAAVLIAMLGEPGRYESAAAYEKALGYNLREKSSGESRGGLHITKRGPGLARMFLHMATLRLLQEDPIVDAWYTKKVRRQGGQAKLKAVVAVTRKLVRALWHVAQGAAFDARLLFDTSRLRLTAEPTPEPIA
ncbi:MAG TPA: transposase [Polyangiaceae bacterium LLY-WYZ-15_(1-7)]|nr:transposase [Polyangiaceae bacterium LLY-WYZ-15_(1-7)]